MTDKLYNNEAITIQEAYDQKTNGIVLFDAGTHPMFLVFTGRQRTPEIQVYIKDTKAKLRFDCIVDGVDRWISDATWMSMREWCKTRPNVKAVDVKIGIREHGKYGTHRTSFDDAQKAINFLAKFTYE